MIAVLLATALAAEPVQVEVDAILGMRAGVSGLVTVEPVSHVEVGGMLTATTDVYAGAPSWVTDGLDPKLNLHLAPMAAVGVHTGPTRVSGALHAVAGVEIYSFREVKTVPALREPVVYGDTGVRFNGGVVTTLRVRPWERVGFTLPLFLPLPLTPTGAPAVERIHAGLGVRFEV